ncbi:kinase-like domain-containing protein [Aspergillus spinulosporus]
MACEKNVRSRSEGHSVYEQVPDGARLPFLLIESGSQLGRGGYGTVTRETIVAGHFLDKNREPNLRDKVIARKCFTDKIYFDRERVIMSLLVNGLLKHNNIVYALAMISLKSEMDSTISLKSLLEQVANLAHALKSLHKPDAPCHIIHPLDLTPKEVLVKLSNDPNRPGTWMLSDFGRSKHYFNRVSAESGSNSVQAERQVSFSGRTSIYLPQEKQRGSYTDTWSLGCILYRVVCPQTPRDRGIATIRRLRFKEDSDENDYFYEGTIVDTCVKELLRQFCSSGCAVTEECGKLLKSILDMDKDRRPKALKLYQDLKNIIDTCEESSHTETSLEINSPRPQRPPLTGHLLTVPGQPFSTRNQPSIADAALRGMPQIQINGDTAEGQEPGNFVDRNPNPIFLAIKNQDENHALVQIKSLFCRSIREYSSIEQYNEGLTPLCHASIRGYTKVVKFMLEKGAPVDERDGRSNTPLMYACKNGFRDTAKKIEIINEFIKIQHERRLELDANILNRLNRTPLEFHLQWDCGHDDRYKIMNRLVSLGANACASPKRNHKRAIDFALENKEKRAMEILIKYHDQTWKVPKSNVSNRGAMKEIQKGNGRLAV